LKSAANALEPEVSEQAGQRCSSVVPVHDVKFAPAIRNNYLRKRKCGQIELGSEIDTAAPVISRDIGTSAKINGALPRTNSIIPGTEGWQGAAVLELMGSWQ
jgi:hypothetical protein